MLPDGNYEKVIIHDNFKALERFANANMFGKIAHYGLRHFNGRFIVFYFNGITLISTGMGSAQTNCLVELLKERGCRVIVKVGTCSALDSSLCEGDILVPDGALIDEGALYWRKVKYDHDRRYFCNQPSVDKYITDREFASPNKKLQTKLVEICKQMKLTFCKQMKLPSYRSDIKGQCVWSVDSYDCFDKSWELYSKVNNQEYYLKDYIFQNQSPMYILGVEMECSSLFSSAQALDIPAAALIVVSRSRIRLLSTNSPLEKWQRYNIPERNIKEIQKSELKCFEVALNAVRSFDKSY